MSKVRFLTGVLETLVVGARLWVLGGGGLLCPDLFGVLCKRDREIRMRRCFPVKGNGRAHQTGRDHVMP